MEELKNDEIVIEQKIEAGVIALVVVLAMLWIIFLKLHIIFRILILISYFLISVGYNSKLTIFKSDHIFLSYPILKKNREVSYENITNINLKVYRYSRMGEYMDIEIKYLLLGKKKDFTIPIRNNGTDIRLIKFLSDKNIKLVSNDKDIMNIIKKSKKV